MQVVINLTGQGPLATLGMGPNGQDQSLATAQVVTSLLTGDQVLVARAGLLTKIDNADFNESNTASIATQVTATLEAPGGPVSATGIIATLAGQDLSALGVLSGGTLVTFGTILAHQLADEATLAGLGASVTANAAAVSSQGSTIAAQAASLGTLSTGLAASVAAESADAATIATHTTELGSLSAASASSAASLSALGGSLVAQGASLAALSGSLTAQGASLGTVTSKQVTDEATLGSLSAGEASTASSLTALGVTVAAQGTSLGTVTSKQAADEVTLASHSASLTSQGSQLIALSGSLTALSGSLSVLSAGLTTTEGKQVTDETTLSSHTASLSLLGTECSNLAGSVTVLSSEIGTSGGVLTTAGINTTLGGGGATFPADALTVVAPNGGTLPLVNLLGRVKRFADFTADRTFAPSSSGNDQATWNAAMAAGGIIEMDDINRWRVPAVSIPYGSTVVLAGNNNVDSTYAYNNGPALICDYSLCTYTTGLAALTDSLTESATFTATLQNRNGFACINIQGGGTLRGDGLILPKNYVQPVTLWDFISRLQTGNANSFSGIALNVRSSGRQQGQPLIVGFDTCAVILQSQRQELDRIFSDCLSHLLIDGMADSPNWPGFHGWCATDGGMVTGDCAFPLVNMQAASDGQSVLATFAVNQPITHAIPLNAVFRVVFSNQLNGASGTSIPGGCYNAKRVANPSGPFADAEATFTGKTVNSLGYVTLQIVGMGGFGLMGGVASPTGLHRSGYQVPVGTVGGVVVPLFQPTYALGLWNPATEYIDGNGNIQTTRGWQPGDAFSKTLNCPALFVGGGEYRPAYGEFYGAMTGAILGYQQNYGMQKGVVFGAGCQHVTRFGAQLDGENSWGDESLNQIEFQAGSQDCEVNGGYAQAHYCSVVCNAPGATGASGHRITSMRLAPSSSQAFDQGVCIDMQAGDLRVTGCHLGGVIRYRVDTGGILTLVNCNLSGAKFMAVDANGNAATLPANRVLVVSDTAPTNIPASAAVISFATWAAVQAGGSAGVQSYPSSSAGLSSGSPYWDNNVLARVP